MWSAEFIEANPETVEQAIHYLGPTTHPGESP